jgi:tetratricopeptide (TPR) repeat protein
MKLRRQIFKPGARIEQIGGIAQHPFFTRQADGGNAPGGLAATPARGPLARIAENAGALFSILVSVLLIALILALVAGFVSEVRRDSVVVTPISVPQDVAARGYDAVAASQLVVNEIATIQASAQTSHVRRSLVSGSDIPDVHIIGAGTSMQSIVRYARSAFGRREATISGLVLRDQGGLRMVINLQDPRGNRRLEVVRHDEDIDALLRDGGRAIVQLADPYVLASYLFNGEAPGGVFTQTEAAIDYVLKNPPADDDGWALNLRGLILERRGDHAAAEAAFRRALTLPGAPAAVIDNNLLTLLGVTGRRAEAHALVMSGTKGDATYDMLSNGCVSLYWMGFPDDGRKLCERAAARDPRAATPWQFRALYDYDAGHFEAGWRAAARSRALSGEGEHDWMPPYVILRAARGDSQGALGDAEQFAATLGDGDPNRAWLAFARATILAALGRDGEAEAALDRFDAAMRAPEWVYFGRMMRGAIDVHRHRPREALAHFEAALAINPDNPFAVAGKARALAALGNVEGSEQAFARAATLAPDRADTFEAWAEARAARGDVAGAQQKHAEAVRATERGRAA